MPRRLFALLFLAFVAGATLLAGRTVIFAFTPARPGATADAAVVIEIRKGQPQPEIARLLAERGVVSDAGAFIRLGRWTRRWRRLKAGEYRVSPAQTPWQVFDTLSSGISIPHPVTVREGENMYEIAAEIEALELAPRARILELCRDPRFIASLPFEGAPPPTLEGYLFPDTYHFNRALAPENMLRQMVRHFRQVWGPEQDRRARELGLTRHQAVTLASMIEKETGASQDRPLISSVFHNRLRKHMRLQSDPTTIYGIWERYAGNLKKSDLLTDTPWNTYTIPGLPVGPIGNPGRAAIEAALAPAPTDYLYFVSQNDGTTRFSSTLEAHNSAVKTYQMNPRARAGKSWRDQVRREKQAPAPVKGAGGR
jgi:UPF0755 protein